ncbi:hypothetical protein POSPLADRAFT_1050214 [Postia placenta MAD-698-R-SB12]|uniref:Uncharacterized protein n=1 Tax=Postia placenta MAD-698-R-SB12 TaxID=670580 RepID=A0A1X6ML83_9APHY|nr:hypothetical protein POSPLADRAFT_1050214 [Postia placenta MAD-698-R-SB12]OSX57154.1 hypothetical protein POSPLADRAFT_1050214 [Postia placenta MAD-698-R-SB12]
MQAGRSALPWQTLETPDSRRQPTLVQYDTRTLSKGFLLAKGWLCFPADIYVGSARLSESSGVRKTRAPASSLVLKPQREGGRNGVYRDMTSAFLDTLPPVEREAWIAVELIAAPKGLGDLSVPAEARTAQ